MILRLPEIYTHNAGIFMYKYTKLLLPPIFNNLFIENSSIHNYPTRHSHLLRIPLVKTKLAENFISKTGVHIWNEITSSLDPNVKLGTFKRNYKKALINNYYNLLSMDA